MADESALEERLQTVERTLVDAAGDDDADADVDGGPLADAAPLAARIDEVEDRLDALQARVGELDAATQAIRGYVGNVRSVNTAIERRADAAISAVDRLESRLDGLESRVDGVESSPANGLDADCHGRQGRDRPAATGGEQGATKDRTATDGGDRSATGSPDHAVRLGNSRDRRIDRPNDAIPDGAIPDDAIPDDAISGTRGQELPGAGGQERRAGDEPAVRGQARSSFRGKRGVRDKAVPGERDGTVAFATGPPNEDDTAEPRLLDLLRERL